MCFSQAAQYTAYLGKRQFSLKNSGISQDAVSNLNDILKLYGEFLSSNIFSYQSTAFPIALDLQIFFLDQEGKELDYKQFTGNVFIHGWGGIFVCM